MTGTKTSGTPSAAALENGGAIEGSATELVPHDDHAPALFGTNDPVEVVEQAVRVADALKAVIVKQRLFANIQRKSYVLVEGWQLLGSMLGVTAVCVSTEPIDGGWKATVEARRTVDGRVIGRADAMCSKNEPRGPWATSTDQARLSMAQTRATSKALKGPLGFIVGLAGYETTPAEEMEQQAARRQAAAATPVADKPVTKKRAGELVDRALAAGITGRELALKLNALGVEHDEIRNKGTAKAALALLTDAQADTVEALIEGRLA